MHIDVVGDELLSPIYGYHKMNLFIYYYLFLLFYLLNVLSL